jgi:hypothetical protein
MSEPVPGHNLRSGDVHFGVYKAIVVLGALFVLAAWGFAGQGLTDMLLVVVSGFFPVCIGLVSLLWFTRPRDPRDVLGDRPGPRESFGDWAGHDVDTSTGLVRGSIITIEALLPIAAVAIGMVAFALVLHFFGRA